MSNTRCLAFTLQAFVNRIAAEFFRSCASSMINDSQTVLYSHLALLDLRSNVVVFAITMLARKTSSDGLLDDVDEGRKSTAVIEGAKRLISFIQLTITELGQITRCGPKEPLVVGPRFLRNGRETGATLCIEDGITRPFGTLSSKLASDEEEASVAFCRPKEETSAFRLGSEECDMSAFRPSTFHQSQYRGPCCAHFHCLQ